MAYFQNVYDFDTVDAPSNLLWDYINPDGSTGLNILDIVKRRWNWHNSRTKSPKCGPNGPYSGNGYIYVETSSPTKANDKFIMVTNTPIDASDRNVKINFRYSANTVGTPCQLVVEVFANDTWYKEFDQNVGSNKADWNEISLDLSKYENIDMSIRITIDLLDEGSTWKKDVGIDNIIITGGDLVTDEVIDFLGSRDIRKLQKHSTTFNAKHKTPLAISTIISEINASNLDFSNYPRGILVVESGTKIHLIKKGVV